MVRAYLGWTLGVIIFGILSIDHVRAQPADGQPQMQQREGATVPPRQNPIIILGGEGRQEATCVGDDGSVCICAGGCTGGTACDCEPVIVIEDDEG